MHYSIDNEMRISRKRYFSQSPTNGHIFRYGHLIIESHKNSTATYSTQNEKEQQQKFQEEESSFFLRSFISRLFDFFFVMFGKIPNEVTSLILFLSVSFSLSFFLSFR
jgi:hypothetical protein